MLSERTIEILEKNDMKVHKRGEEDGYYREIEFYSPEGEDVIETIWYDGTDKGFVTAFSENAEHFEPDEHAEVYIESRGTRGIPDSIRDLIDDANWIKNTLLDVADELEADENDEAETMNRTEFYVYIVENFDLDVQSAKLVENILYFVEDNYKFKNEQQKVLWEMLDCIDGLPLDAVKKVCM